MGIQELERSLDNQKSDIDKIKLLKVSKKNIGIAVLATVFIPLLGYAYTGRWKAFLYLLLAAFAVGLISGNADNAFGIGALIGGVGGAIEQAIGITNARATVEALRNLER